MIERFSGSEVQFSWRYPCEHLDWYFKFLTDLRVCYTSHGELDQLTFLFIHSLLHHLWALCARSRGYKNDVLPQALEMVQRHIKKEVWYNVINLNNESTVGESTHPLKVAETEAEATKAISHAYTFHAYLVLFFFLHSLKNEIIRSHWRIICYFSIFSLQEFWG